MTGPISLLREPSPLIRLSNINFSSALIINVLIKDGAIIAERKVLYF